ncbi:hypothetical protein I5M32_09290 [Pedobacter sp. SD-b]|uniref:ATPase n=1 Tax=Pedobacter segetis TaxID=2793069 RepID=A0ABS1BK83_9SPHI|nr:DUF4175 family protein [Pedobacter segetis]MBK0383151.1 hypothetical protein [Pedobacter segetis]
MNTAYQQLLKKIDDFIRKYYLNKIVRGAIWLAGVFIICYLFLIVSEYYSYFSIGTRTILFYTFIITQIILGWFLVFRHLINYLNLGNTINHEKASEIIGQHFANIGDKLINTLQLKKLSQENIEQSSLIEASINQRIAGFKPIPFIAAVKIRDNKKYFRFLSVPLAAIIVIAFSAPSILKDGTKRIVNYNTFYKKNAPFNFNILNRSLEAVQGDDFTLTVKMGGNEIPQDIYLKDGINTFKLDKKDVINFSYQFKNLQQNKKFRLTSGEFSSDEFTIYVKKKPILLSYNAQLYYPSYLKKQPETLQNPGDLTLPVGTIVKWNFDTENVSDLEFNFNNKKTNLKPGTKNGFSYQNSVLKQGAYSIILKNNDVNTKDSISYQLTTIPDAFPKIEIKERIDSANLNVLYFIGKADDDHGLSSLDFHYQIINSSDGARKNRSFKVPVKFDALATQSSFFYLWQLKTLGLKAGEEISYYFDVADNDGVFGPKHTKSATKIYKLASKDEAIKKIDETSQAINQKMESAIRQAENIQKDTKKLNQDLIEQKSINYQQKKQIETLVDKQKKLEDLIKDIQKDGKQNLRDRQDVNPDQQKILEKQKQIQDLFDNVLDNKTKKLLENLQKLMDQNQKDLSQDQLQKMQLDNKSLEKELDRILDLYKKLEVEQKLNDAIDKLTDLAKKQEDLSQEALNKNNKENLDKQKDLNKNFDQLKKDLKEVDQKNQELDRPADFKNPEEEQKSIEQEMDNAQQNLEDNKAQKAAQAQKSAAQKMQQLSQNLKQMQGGAQEEENKVNEKELRQILQNLLKTSFDQEKIMLDLKSINPDDPNFVKLAQKQREIKDNLKNVEDSLYSLSKKVPQIASTVNKEISTINQQITEGLDKLTDRKISEANRNQQFALTSINNLALMLSEALQQLQNAMKNAQSGGKGKSKPNLSQLSEMQKQLNKNMQNAKEQMQKQGIKPGQKGNPQMSEQMAKMAQQQQMIRQALQEINNELNKDGRGKLGNLEKTVEQMEQTETDLVNKRITQEALLRQQEIQTRLLEADKAERERDQDDKRESKAGKDFTPNYNLILEEYQKQKAKEVEQIKTMPPALNYFYKSKISEYFKKLNLGE